MAAKGHAFGVALFYSGFAARPPTQLGPTRVVHLQDATSDISDFDERVRPLPKRNASEKGEATKMVSP